MQEKIYPTRSQLIMLRRRIRLAQRGHELLRRKRDALMAEFFDSFRKYKQQRSLVKQMLSRAYRELSIAQVILGQDVVMNQALACGRDLELDSGCINIMGVIVPWLELRTDPIRDPHQRGYGLRDSSVALDRAAEEFEKLLPELVKLGEYEQRVRVLAMEISELKRRVNALEQVVIPRLKSQESYIRFRIEEMEREDFVRLKLIKARV